MNEPDTPTEIRQGKTGTWKFMLRTDEGKVLACSAWGTAYEFSQAEWDALAVVPATPRCPGDGQP